MTPKILIVEDETALVTLLRYNLEREGYAVSEAGDGEEAMLRISEDKPDLVILDWMLPLLSGIEVCRRLRRAPETRALPVLMLTARGEEADKVRGLDCGADDYMTKPFSPRTLLARVRALLRRAGREGVPTMAAGHLALDPETHSVSVHGAPAVGLTRLEFRLLHLLLANAGATVSVDRLTAHVWGYRGLGDRQLLKQLVRRLRLKIEPDAATPRYLLADPGSGYRLEPAP